MIPFSVFVVFTSSSFLISVFLDTAVAWMPGAVPHLENWVRSLVSTSIYGERAWRNLSKSRWEARTHGKPSSWLTDLLIVQVFFQA